MADKLYFACKGGQVSVVKNLLSQGTGGGLDERVYDNQLGYSSTPLHAAVMGGNTQLVETLLTNGANPSVVDEEDVSPLSRACKSMKVSEAMILLKYGARPYDDSPESYTKSPWHQAVMADSSDLVGAMLDQNPRLIEAHGPTKWNGLHYASQNGKTKVAKLLIKRKSGVDIPINTGRTPLHLAAFQGHSSILEALLTANANPNIKSSNGDGSWTPLILAAQEGRTECVRHLVADKRINVQLRAKNGRNALHSCSFHGHFEIAKMLIDKGIETHIGDENGWTQLHLCCQENHFKIVEYILSKGKRVDPMSKAKNGRTPLHSASLKGNHEAVALLIKHKVKIDEPDSRRWTPLHVACQNGKTECARILLTSGANANCQIDSGRNTLHLVAFEGYKEIARMLLDKGADYKHADSQQWTPLHLCTQEGKTDIALMILEKADVPINARAHNGRTSLHSASYNGRTEIARVLLQKKADVMVQDKDGWTALHLAAQQGHDEIVRMLVGSQAVVNKQSSNERTPLHLASMKGHKDIVLYLLNQGADILVKDCKKWIALHVASNHAFPDIVRLLLDRGSPIDDLIDMGRSSLHLAAFNGHTEVTDLLLQRGATVDLADKDNWTSLHLACQEGKLGVVRKLLERGANVHAKANNGRTPLHSAVTSGVSEIIADLIGRGANLSAVMNDGQTPLHTAVLYKQADAVSVLLDKGAPINYVKNNGDTALHVAASEGSSDICQALLAKGIDRNLSNNSGNTAVMVARQKGHNSIANLIQNFVQTQPISPPVLPTPTAPPHPSSTAEKKQALFVAFGPNEVQGGEEVTLRIYCIDTADSTAKDDVYQFEKQGDRVPWGPPCRCNLTVGAQVDLSVERTSTNFIMSKESMRQNLESEWIGFTSADFEIDVGNPASMSREEVLIRISCQNSKITDLKSQWKVKPVPGLPTGGSDPPPYPVDPPTYSEDPPAYPQEKAGEITLPPAPSMQDGKFIFVSYSSSDKENILPIVYYLLEQQVPVWLDMQQIAPGEMWDEQLGFALRKCKGVLCCLSDNWFSSVNCKTELRAVRCVSCLHLLYSASSVASFDMCTFKFSSFQSCHYSSVCEMYEFVLCFGELGVSVLLS
jgi:ankyrin repeat protein